MRHFEISELNSIVLVREDNSKVKNRFNTFSYQEDFDVVYPFIQRYKNDDVIPVQVRSSIQNVVAEIYNNGSLVKTIQAEKKTDNLNKKITLDCDVEYLYENRYLVSFSDGLTYKNDTDIDTVSIVDLISDSDNYIDFIFGKGASMVNKGSYWHITDGDGNEADIDSYYIHVEDMEYIYNVFKKFPKLHLDIIEKRIGSDVSVKFLVQDRLNKYYIYRRDTGLNYFFFESKTTGKYLLYTQLNDVVNYYQEIYYLNSYKYGFIPDFMIGIENPSELSIDLAGLNLPIVDFGYSQTNNSYGLVVESSNDISGKKIARVTYNLEQYDVYEFDIRFSDYENVNVRVKAKESNTTVFSELSELIKVGEVERNFVEMVYFGETDKYINYSTGIKHMLRVPVDFSYDKSNTKSENQINDDNVLLISSNVNFGNTFEISGISQSFARKINLAVISPNLYINNVKYVLDGDYSTEIQKNSNLVDVSFSLIEAEKQPAEAIFKKEVPKYIILSEGESIIDFNGNYLF